MNQSKIFESKYLKIYLKDFKSVLHIFSKSCAIAGQIEMCMQKNVENFESWVWIKKCLYKIWKKWHRAIFYIETIHEGIPRSGETDYVYM
jgi:hypothetical protein